jgi:hypothetical protein
MGVGGDVDPANCPAMPDEVARALAALPPPIAMGLAETRRLIFATAATTPGVGPLTETLKWGEPAYLTEATGSGSTIRLGVVAGEPGLGAVLFNCRTTLIDEFRSIFGAELRFSGSRAIMFDPQRPLPVAALRLCLAMALTYRSRWRGSRIWAVLEGGP